nr:TonB-dependent receptor [Sandaracinobacteroides sayramensis]
MKFHLLLGCAFPLSLFLSLPAQAQTGDKPVREVAEADDIIVTGSRREERLADAPVAATVMGENFVREARIDSLRQIDDFVPNVQFNQTSQIGGTYITIRGIESNPFIVNRAAVYVDGVPFRSVDNLVLPAIEQIEVLRGPQGTLYGANTESGLIIIRTRAPSDHLEAEASGSVYGFGNGHGVELTAHVSGPLTSTLGASLTVKHENTDSFTRNIASSIGEPGALRETYVQGRLRWEPTDRLTLDLLGNAFIQRTPGLYELEFSPMDRDIYNLVYLGTLNSKPNGRFERVNDAPANTRLEAYTFATAATYEFDFAKLDANFSIRRERNSSQGLDIDLTAAPLSAGGNRTRDRELNAEIRLSALTSSTIQWVIGVNGYTERHRGQLGTLLGAGGIDDYSYAPWQANEGKGYALFGQATIPLAATVHLTGGLRYDWAERTKRQAAGELNLGPLGTFLYTAENRTGSFDEFLPKLAIDWKAAPNLLLYASAAKGWIPGGFNLQAAVPSLGERFTAYDSETLKSYEAGFKLELLDRRLLLSAAAFHIKASNWQENVVPTDDNGVVLSTTVVTSDSSIRSNGFEMELVGRPAANLDLALSFGYVDARYVEYRYDTTRDYSGNRVKLTPQWDFSASASWRPWDGLFLRGEANGTGKAMLNPANTVAQDMAWMFNAQIGWEAERWSARLFAENIADKLVYTSTAYENFLFGFDGGYYATPGKPRVIGVEFGLKF